MNITYNINKDDIRSMIELIQFLNNKLNNICDKDALNYINEEMSVKLCNYATDLYNEIINIKKENLHSQNFVLK